jgi:proteasome alpha subunit
MSVPYYVSPEQIIADKAEFAAKGIRRGRSVVVICANSGVLFVADNPSRALHKIGEIYDRIGFAAVGKYNEFENLRVAGVRLADMRGFSYDRADVTVRTIANAYAQTLGNIFIEAAKPYEVELAVAEVGDSPENDQLYRISFDGSVHDQSQFVCMGGESEKIAELIQADITADMSVKTALQVAIRAMRPDTDESKLTGDLEVALLDRNRPRRTFVRFTATDLEEMLR